MYQLACQLVFVFFMQISHTENERYKFEFEKSLSAGMHPAYTTRGARWCRTQATRNPIHPMQSTQWLARRSESCNDNSNYVEYLCLLYGDVLGVENCIEFAIPIKTLRPGTRQRRRPANASSKLSEQVHASGYDVASFVFHHVVEF